MTEYLWCPHCRNHPLAMTGDGFSNAIGTVWTMFCPSCQHQCLKHDERKHVVNKIMQSFPDPIIRDEEVAFS